MKLKKIASLMLAGVMAVSMLTGCSGKTDDDNNGGAGTEVTPTSSTATTLRAELGGNARVNVKAVANNKLDSALKDAIDDYVNDSQLSLIAGKYYVEGNDVRTWNVGKAVIKAMGNKDSIADDIVMTNDKTTTKRNIQPMFLLLLIAPKQKNFASRKIGSLCGGWRKPAPALLVVGHIASCLRPAGVL